MNDALKEYEANSDKVGRFIAERLKPTPGHRVTVSVVYDAYREWCYENGCHAEALVHFKEKLRDHGAEIDRARPSAGGGATTVLCGFTVMYDSPVPVSEIHEGQSA